MTKCPDQTCRNTIEECPPSFRCADNLVHVSLPYYADPLSQRRLCERLLLLPAPSRMSLFSSRSLPWKPLCGHPWTSVPLFLPVQPMLLSAVPWETARRAETYAFLSHAVPRRVLTAAATGVAWWRWICVPCCPPVPRASTCAAMESAWKRDLSVPPC